jgi:hypothetical protein
MAIDADKHFELAVSLAREGLRSLAIVNGGAAIAMIALVGHLLDGNSAAMSVARPFLLSIVLFGAGTMVGVLALFFAYFSQLEYANHLTAAPTGNQAACRYRWHGHWWWATLVATAVALGFGAAGVYFAWAAVSQA